MLDSKLIIYMKSNYFEVDHLERKTCRKIFKLRETSRNTCYTLNTNVSLPIPCCLCSQCFVHTNFTTRFPATSVFSFWSKCLLSHSLLLAHTYLCWFVAFLNVNTFTLLIKEISLHFDFKYVFQDVWSCVWHDYIFNVLHLIVAKSLRSRYVVIPYEILWIVYVI